MEINNLKEGMVIKNYKVLCELLEIEATTSNSKLAQFKELERYINYEKQGQKFIIKEIFDEPIKKEENKGNTGNFKQYDNLNVEQSKWNNTGVYYIIKDNDIYIGSTFKGYRERFMEHYNGYDERMRHTYELLQSGADFNILYDMTGTNDIELIRMVENEFINYFDKDTNYNVINKISGWNLNKIKYKKITIQEDKYEQAMQLLIDNGLIESCENNKILNNDAIQEIEFSMNNIPF